MRADLSIRLKTWSPLKATRWLGFANFAISTVSIQHKRLSGALHSVFAKATDTLSLDTAIGTTEVGRKCSVAWRQIWWMNHPILVLCGSYWHLNWAKYPRSSHLSEESEDDYRWLDMIKISKINSSHSKFVSGGDVQLDLWTEIFFVHLTDMRRRGWWPCVERKKSNLWMAGSEAHLQKPAAGQSFGKLR